MGHEYPVVSGYEWQIECPCGETMAAAGMDRGKRGDDWLLDRRTDELPQTDGDTIECENCGKEWRLSFFGSDE